MIAPPTPEDHPALSPSHTVAWVVEPSPSTPAATVYLACDPDTAPLVLTGSAALIWTQTVAAAPAPVSAIVAAVAAAADVPAAELVDDVEAFLNDLVARGALHRGPARSGP